MTGVGGFITSEEYFVGVVSFLAGSEAAAMEHAELEACLQAHSTELFRRLSQDHVDLRAEREQRLGEVADAKGVDRPSVEAGHARALAMVFGEIQVRRFAYRKKGYPNLHPADGSFNLPDERHSHGFRRLAAIEASRGSFQSAAEAIERATGQRVGKRQVEQLTRRAAVDVEAFYEQRLPDQVGAGDVVVISCDGKGIVMRPEALREQTKKVAQAATTKLHTRLSKGEKHGRKRMATVGAVYDVTPAPRTPDDVFGSRAQPRVEPPVAKNKWLTASVVRDAAAVVSHIFDQAERRDPDHARTWIALVDGNNHQIDRIHQEAKTRGVDVSIVVDLIHVLEYLWSAAWCFFAEGDRSAEEWVRDRAVAVLDGGARDVAAGIRRRASTERLKPADRHNADTCASYLTNKAAYLDYPKALSSGWPIATGVIEGACRHICKDRMDLTGARWGLKGAEAVLKLRTVRSNRDFDKYWQFHLARERERVHASRYTGNVVPVAA
ncbi:MAG: ISKra4 family transposase [Acidimicrobiales bacterium]